MRSRSLRVLLVIALLIGLPALLSADGDGGRDVLHDSMEALDDAFKAIRKSIRKPAEYDKAIALVHECQKRVMIAKAALPATIGRAPQEKRAALTTEYRVRMAHLLREFCTLEVALLEGESDDAQASYKRLIDQRFKGHLNFKEQ